MLQLKVAALAGLVLAAPVVMWQVWLFVAPGLYAKEKRFAAAVRASSRACSSSAARRSRTTSCFPTAWTFLASFTTDYMEFTPKISSSLRPLRATCCWPSAVIFQMPTLVLALARMGVVTAGFLWRHTKYAILIIFIIAAVITPTSRRREPDADGRRR